jgi:hypothetical protein
VIGRLGEVIYWCGAGLGALFEIAGWAAIIFGPPEARLVGVIAVVIGIIIFGIGRAALYVLTGR